MHFPVYGSCQACSASAQCAAKGAVPVSEQREQQHAALVLADGRIFTGRRFGAAPESVEAWCRMLEDGSAQSRLSDIGEVVFNTAMSGYPEVFTDPSYTGQIVAMTYPHLGNYGVDPEWSERGPGDERPRPVMVAGVVCRSLYRGPVRAGRQTLDDYLAGHGIPGIEGVDTRALTLHLRRGGVQNGVICAAAPEGEYAALVTALSRFPAMEGRGLIDEVGAGASLTLEALEPAPRETRGPHLVLYDCGAKANIIREFRRLGCRISVLPSTASAAELRDTGADALLLSNGPGDPAVLQHQVAQTRELVGAMPLLGICLGHQIIAEAVGGTTAKMRFGHHGINHPVRDELTRRVFVTSQNHGFTVEEDSLPAGVDIWFRNANDGSIEGLRDERRRIRTTQFHPEAAPGPVDSRWIFSAFLEAIPGYGGEG